MTDRDDEGRPLGWQWETPEFKGKLDEAFRQLRPYARPEKRPRLVPDAESAIKEAVRGLRRERGKLTWVNVALWMRRNTPGCESLDEGTLRRWAREDGLPRPSNASWNR